jgi:hypothetical protein
MRDKLIELLYENNVRCDQTIEDLADDVLDHLVENNVAIADHNLGRGWINVEEKLPEDDLPKDTTRKQIRCFVYTDKGTIKPCTRIRYRKVSKEGLQLSPWYWSKDLYAKPTYWMIYPEPPKEEENTNV